MGHGGMVGQGRADEASSRDGSPGEIPSSEALDAVDLHIASLDAAGSTAEALALAVTTAQQRIESLALTRTMWPRRKLTMETRIFLCGYFYSGSGAVVDYLKDFSGVKKKMVPGWGNEADKVSWRDVGSIQQTERKWTSDRSKYS